MSSSFEYDWPDVGYNKDDEEFYNYLKKSDSPSPFSSMRMSDIFIYAMSLGFKYGIKHEIESNKRQPNLPPSAFDPDMRWLMRAVAVTDEENLEIIAEHKKVIKIAEAYANGGFSLIRDYMKKQSIEYGADAVFESELRKVISELA